MKKGETWVTIIPEKESFDEVTGWVKWPDECIIVDMGDDATMVTYRYPEWPNRGDDRLAREKFVKIFKKKY